MKKNSAQKSTLKSWLIALIVFVVVAIIAVGVSFIPNSKSCKEVAKADVTQIVSGNYYHMLESFTFNDSTSNTPTYKMSCSGVLFRSPNGSHVLTEIYTFSYIALTYSSQGRYHSLLFMDSSSTTLKSLRFSYDSSTYLTTFNPVSATDANYDYYILSNTTVPVTNGFFALIKHYFEDYTPVVSPVLGSAIDFAFIVNSALYDGVPNAYVYLHCYEITNASAVAVNDSYVDIVVMTHYSRPNLDTTNTYIVPNINGKYYLCLVLPPDIVSTEFVDSVYIGFTTAQSSDDFLSLPSSVISDFQENGELLAAYTDVIRNQAFYNGYDVGYSQGTANQNNLVDVIWATIQMPVRILFGDIDSDVESTTYNQYVGGLFNFTILGLDIRAFVLSIMSVCIIIAIMKIVVKFVV